MNRYRSGRRNAAFLATVAIAVVTGCGGKPPATSANAATAPVGAGPATAAAPQAAALPLAPNSLSWTPEGMEELLAPAAEPAPAAGDGGGGAGCARATSETVASTAMRGRFMSRWASLDLGFI